jgi:hypothetical protein
MKAPADGSLPYVGSPLHPEILRSTQPGFNELEMCPGARKPDPGLLTLLCGS